MMPGRKRVFASPSQNVSDKRSKFANINIKRKTKNVSQWTSQSGTGNGLGFVRRPFNPSQYKKLLWDASTVGQHFRSNIAATSSVSTPASSASMTVSFQTSRRFAGNAFWTALGGAINPDGGAIPTFQTNTDFTIRGGIMGIRISNNPDTLAIDQDSMNVTVYQIWTTKNFSTTNIPTTVSVGWDPSLIQDFQTNIGKVLWKKNYVIEDGASIDIERRMPVQKIDQTEYGATISEPAWLVCVGNTGTSGAKVSFVTTYYNMSFVGDAV